MYPLIRNRRLRINESIRSLVRETHLCPSDFIAPLFITEGNNVKQEIYSLPNYYRLSSDLISYEIERLWSIGIKSVLLFVKVEDHLKNNKGTEAINSEGLMQRTIKTIKKVCSEMIVMTDVALDPYSSYGHDGIVEEEQILNDATNEVLAKMALSHAEAGADIIAPSDMMDGRILKIRESLEESGYIHTGIMSYSAKYASCFYGPFRDALDSKPGFGDKKTYQMDFANSDEAIKETLMDIQEGADVVMIKPAGCYLDIIQKVKQNVDVPVAAYQVSGEYAMIKAAAQKGWVDESQAIIESIMSIKRSGANMIATYFVKDIIRLLQDN